jgi:hypothetical protein
MFRVLAIALGLFASGCGDDQLERMEAIKHEVCACKSPACAETAIKSLRALQVESTPRSQRFARDMLDCMAKLATADRPSTDPDGNVP